MTEYTVARADLESTLAEIGRRGELVASVTVIPDPLLEWPIPLEKLRRIKRLKVDDLAAGYKIVTTPGDRIETRGGAA
jgi:hypothetical protein